MTRAVAAAVTVATASVSLGVGSSATGAGPDGLARIVFTNGGRIFTIEADGSDRTRLTGGPVEVAYERSDQAPAWSPDGSQIAFSRSFELEEEFETRSQIFLMDADGSGIQPFTDANDKVEEGYPDWSPDGSSIAFMRWRFGAHALVTSIVIRDLGTGDERVVAGKQLDYRTARRLAFVTEPAWSPAGDRLTFTRSRVDRDYDFRPSVHVVDADGTDSRLLRDKGSAASWSPDGSQIAFSSIRDKNGKTCGSDECSYNGEIYVMDADGTDLSRLTFSKARDQAPDWSGDGQRLVFASNRNQPGLGFGGEELYSIEADGECLTWLTNGTPDSVNPRWEADASASASAGGCGPVPRSPVGELDLTRAHAVTDQPVFWLGESYRGVLVSHFEKLGHDLFFGYYDCTKYFADDCRPPYVGVQHFPSCTPRLVFDEALYIDRFLKRRGVLVGYGSRIGLIAYTGGLSVNIFVGGRRTSPDPERDHLRALRQLRKLDQTAPRAELPSTRFSGKVIREARKVLAAYQRLGTVAAVSDELDLGQFRVRGALAIGRAIDRFGPVRRISCP